MQLTHEVVAQQLIEGQPAVENRWQQLLGDVLLHRLFEVVNSSFSDRLSKEVSDMREQRVHIVVGNRRFTVARRQGHQGRDWRSAKNLATCAERT